MDDDLNFDFEGSLDPPQQDAVGHSAGQGSQSGGPVLAAGANIGQQPSNFKKNFRKTVCTYWLRGLCMKGDTCGFLHQFDPDRMPVCRALLKYGECKEPDCPYKHSMDDIKECNMYKLGFCVYGPQCRYKHTREPGPPPDPAGVEACKPQEFRDINKVVNTANAGIAASQRFNANRPRFSGRGQMLPGSGGQGVYARPALPAPGSDSAMQQGGMLQGPMLPPGAPVPPPRPPPGQFAARPGFDSRVLAAVGQQGLPYGF